MVVTAQNSLESILRKRVYSFKHSGISRGGHRGPEKVSPDRQSGHEMSDLGLVGYFSSNFLK
jgi:hypothetical protein